MPKFLDGPARRAAAATAVVLLLLATAVAITLLRYESAIHDEREAREETGDQLASERAIAAFWREQSAVTDYALTKDAAELGEFERAEADLTRVLSEFETSE